VEIHASNLEACNKEHQYSVFNAFSDIADWTACKKCECYRCYAGGGYFNEAMCKWFALVSVVTAASFVIYCSNKTQNGWHSGTGLLGLSRNNGC